jgi:hypothetical protein
MASHLLENIMTTAVNATLSATPVATPIPAGSAAFGHWNFDFVDAAGTKAPTQTGDGVSVVSAVFPVGASAAGLATFTVTAVDSTGTAMGIAVTVTATLPFTLVPATFPAPTAATLAFS